MPAAGRAAAPARLVRQVHDRPGLPKQEWLGRVVIRAAGFRRTAGCAGSEPTALRARDHERLAGLVVEVAAPRSQGPGGLVEGLEEV